MCQRLFDVNGPIPQGPALDLGGRPIDLAPPSARVTDNTGAVVGKVIIAICVFGGLAASGVIAGLLLGQNGGEWWPWPILYLVTLGTPVAVGASYVFLVLLALVSNVVALPARGFRSLNGRPTVKRQQRIRQSPLDGPASPPSITWLHEFRRGFGLETTVHDEEFFLRRQGVYGPYYPKEN